MACALLAHMVVQTMSSGRIVSLFGACAVALALTACGGKSSSRADGTGGTRNGGAGGTTASGGSNSGGETSLACTQEGTTELIGGVRFQCTEGSWSPLDVCMMGRDLSACCPGTSAMRSIDVASDPCLVPFPDAADGSMCIRTRDCDGVVCELEDVPTPRTAQATPDGGCVPVNECERAGDCVIAVDHLSCCPCPGPFPRTMLAREPCITDPEITAPRECGVCASGCEACLAPRDPTVRCIPNAAGIRSCAYAPQTLDCGAQDAVGLYPDPPGGVCLPAKWTWNGTACVGFEGCLCSGADCGALFDSPDACLEQYRMCGAVCVPGMDQTCNDDPIISSIAGHCDYDGTCACPADRTYVQASGRCR